jgi:Uma2 family endonuclease
MAVASKAKTPGDLSAEEYLHREQSADVRSEYIYGRIVAMAGASRNHNRIVANLATSIGLALRPTSCNHYSSDMRVGVAGDKAFLYPDLVVTCGEEQLLPTTPETLVNPLVIIEVLSPSTEARDRGEKFLCYQSIPSLREYVLVSQWPRRFETYLKQEGGAWEYRSSPDPPAELHIAALELTIPAAEIYARVAEEST